MVKYKPGDPYPGELPTDGGGNVLTRKEIKEQEKAFAEIERDSRNVDKRREQYEKDEKLHDLTIAGAEHSHEKEGEGIYKGVVNTVDSIFGFFGFGGGEKGSMEKPTFSKSGKHKDAKEMEK